MGSVSGFDMMEYRNCTRREIEYLAGDVKKQVHMAGIETHRSMLRLITSTMDQTLNKYSAAL